jgi:hypothetical protein
MSASMAHEIRNPLASIRAAAGELSDLATASEDDRTLLSVLVRECDRLNKIISDFLEFASDRKLEVSLCQLLHGCTPNGVLTIDTPPTIVKGEKDRRVSALGVVRSPVPMPFRRRDMVLNRVPRQPFRRPPWLGSTAQYAGLRAHST